MNVTMHMPPLKVTATTTVVHQTGTGPVGEVHFAPEAGFAVFRCLEDYDEWIRALVLAKAEFGEALMRHEARPLVPVGHVLLGDEDVTSWRADPEPLPDLPQRARDRDFAAEAAAEYGDEIPGPLADELAHPADGLEPLPQRERDAVAEVWRSMATAEHGPGWECSDPPAESCADAGCPEHGSAYAGLTEGVGDEDDDDDDEPQPGGTIYAELSEEALAAHAPLASLAADPDEDSP